MDIKKITNLIFEISQLSKKVQSGWLLVGVKDPYSISDHITRAAQIGYILAIMEGSNNPEKIATIVLFHNNGKTRIGDQDKVAARYMFKKEGEELSFTDQISGLDRSLENKLISYYKEINERETKEGIIARDADWLEQAFQAKEYYDIGHKSAIKWIDNMENLLETKSAKIIIKEMKKTYFHEWWDNLMMMTYKKINYNK